MPHHKFTFENQEGVLLSGRLELPAQGKVLAYALFAHCFTCSKNLTAVSTISKALSQEGIAVLRFDFTGLGESEGDFADTNFSSNVEDLVAAAEALEEQYRAPTILIGHSLGGAAVLQAASKLQEVKAVATIGAPYDPAHVQHLIASSEAEIRENGHAVVNLAGRSFTIKRQFLEDLEAQKVQPILAGLGKALLIFHAPGDRIVHIDNAAQIYESARHPKSFVSLDDADHLLSRKEDARYIGVVLAAWALKYIDAPNELDKPPEAEKGEVVVQIGAAGYHTKIMAGRHTLVSDEPIALGGTDQGATPYDLLLAGLGACTVITLRMYADRKKWPLEGVEVRLKHEKIYARDCETCSADPDTKISRIHRQLTFQGALDEAQVKRLQQIADRCPVHRTLTSEISIKTELVSQSFNREQSE